MASAQSHTKRACLRGARAAALSRYARSLLNPRGLHPLRLAQSASRRLETAFRVAFT